MIDVVNAMSVDVEDYFQVSAFDRVVSRASWESLESRVDRNTRRLLDAFDDAGVRATFFVLGWIAARSPELGRVWRWSDATRSGAGSASGASSRPAARHFFTPPTH